VIVTGQILEQAKKSQPQQVLSGDTPFCTGVSGGCQSLMTS